MFDEFFNNKSFLQFMECEKEEEKEKEEEGGNEKGSGSEEFSSMNIKEGRSNIAEYLLDSGNGPEYVTLILQLTHATGQ